MVDKYFGIVLIAIILFYLFRNANGTALILKSLSGFNVNAINALQGNIITPN